MKIAFVTHWLSSAGGGVSTVVEALSAALESLGTHEVRVFGLADCYWHEQQSEWFGAPVRGFETKGPPSLGFAPELSQALFEFDPDVVHTHGIWMHTSSAVSKWSRSTGKPYIVSPHGMLDPWALNLSRLKKRMARHWFEDRHLSGAASLHALNSAEALAIRQFGLRPPIATIPNGVDIVSEQSMEPPPWAGKFGTDVKVLLFLGRLHPKKNVDGLLRALGALRTRRQINEWCIVIAGPGPQAYSETLAELASQLGLDDITYFPGELLGKSKLAAFQGASAFILPSFSEGLPMTVLEAWSHSLPVAMTNECNLQEAFQIDAAARIPHCPAKMAPLLGAFLAQSVVEMNGLGARGKALVDEKYSWSTTADNFDSLYREVQNKKIK